ncbi:hypothetical protein ACUSIJ_28005 [Pseudochelatococcus sp. B33]
MNALLNALRPPDGFDVSFGVAGRPGARAAARMRCRAGEPLRLNHIGAVLPPVASPLGAGGMRDVLLAALKRLCDPWDGSLRRLLDRYFAFLTRAVDRAREAIERRLAPFQGLYRPQDTLFSAPALLPRARVEHPDLRDLTLPALLWSGSQLTALFDGGIAETPRRAGERKARLEAAGARIALFAPRASDGEDDRFFAALLGPELVRFFETEAVPSGPLAPDLAPGPADHTLSTS